MKLPFTPATLLVGAVVLASCTADDPSPTSVPTLTPAATAAATTAATPSPTPTPEPTATASPPMAAEPPPIGLEVVGSGLSEPIGISPVPDGRLLVNERAGRVLLLDPATGTIETALDITDRVLGEAERGLLGLALHPAWPDDPRAFVHYTDGEGRTVVSTFAPASIDPLRIDPASESVLLTVEQPYANHNGGQLSFGPDGFLYLGLGDGGSGGDPLGHGQNPRTLLGAILRIDVGAPGPTAYAIPADNPFADGVGGAPEVFAFGLRNPWRFSFDRRTGALWIADVGQGAWEEVNRIEPAADAGANLGWNVMEGAHCYATPDCGTAGLTLPVAEYGHDRGCSVVGGYVYRGNEIAGLDGWYLFADYCTGAVMTVRSDASATDGAPPVLLKTDAGVTAFGEAADGELYLTDIGAGIVYRIVAGG
jgi:glucose/arabinose dehydrogenase